MAANLTPVRGRKYTDSGVNPNPLNMPENPPEHPGERVLREQGTCANHPHPEWWTDPTGEPVPDRPLWRPERYRYDYRDFRPGVHARAICLAQCPVRDLCQQVGDYIETYGTSGDDDHYLSAIWGGENMAERARRRREEAEHAQQAA